MSFLTRKRIRVVPACFIASLNSGCGKGRHPGCGPENVRLSGLSILQARTRLSPEIYPLVMSSKSLEEIKPASAPVSESTPAGHEGDEAEGRYCGGKNIENCQAIVGNGLARICATCPA